jgi:RNA polymerase sigma factor (sigma-70 family)
MDDAAPGVRSTDAARAQRREAPSPVPRRFDADERLIAAVRGGSDEAFRMLYERHHAVVRGLCRQMLGSAEEADDAVQHTFTAAYVDIMRTPKPIVLRPWLLTIARHRCLTVIASRRRSSAYALQDSPSAAVTLDVDVREDLRALMDDIAHLPDEQRVALVMRELRGASYAEIAEILEAPAARGRWLVFQARSWLRSSREAREIPCAEIRELLSSSSGAALRRADLRHHLRQCEGCRAFAADLRGPRARFKSLLPLSLLVVLKRAALGALATSCGGGGVALLNGVAVKVLVAITLAGGGGVAGAAATGGSGKHQAAPRAAEFAGAGAPANGVARPARASGQARGSSDGNTRDAHVEARTGDVRTKPARAPADAPAATPVATKTPLAATASTPADPPKAPRHGGGQKPDASPAKQKTTPPGQTVAAERGGGPPGPPVVPGQRAGPPPKPPTAPGPPSGHGGKPPGQGPVNMPGTGSGGRSGKKGGGPPVHGRTGP